MDGSYQYFLYQISLKHFVSEDYSQILPNLGTEDGVSSFRS